MKVKRVEISSAVLVQWLSHGTCAAKVIENGLPEDAVLCDAFAQDECEVVLTFRSDSFPDIPDGEQIPYLAPIYQSGEEYDAEKV